MGLFLSQFEKKIDKKGRVSVPSQFRNVLVAENFSGIVAYESFVNEAIEASGMSRIEKLSESIENLDPFSPEYGAFATTILAGAVQLQFDSEGRVILPEKLITKADISDKCVFVGMGKTFEIWNPEKFEIHAQAAKELAKKNRNQLSFNKPREV